MISQPPVKQYDVLWKGQTHHNFCVPIRDGKTTIKVDGMPDYQLYFVLSGATSTAPSPIFAQGLETDGRIDIETPDAPHTDGQVCLGVAS
jgi:hypothetical protein